MAFNRSHQRAIFQRKEEIFHIMYAVIETGGKQYRAEVGSKFRVERLSGETSTEIIFDKVIAVGGEGSDTRFGDPYVIGARVTAEIIKQSRADKVLVFKYKSKKNYRKMRGHRQYFTEVVITNIEA